MFLKTFIAVMAAGAFISAQAVDFSKIYEIKRWTPAECTMSAAQVKGKPALIINMPVDHKAGQKDYPIGWPRTYLQTMTAAEGNWSDAAKFTCKIKLEFTGASKKYPLTLHFFTKGEKKSKTVTVNLKNNETNDFSLDLSKLPSKQITGLGFNISESNFKHGDNFKITVSDLALVK